MVGNPRSLVGIRTFSAVRTRRTVSSKLLQPNSNRFTYGNRSTFEYISEFGKNTTNFKVTMSTAMKGGPCLVGSRRRETRLKITIGARGVFASGYSGTFHSQRPIRVRRDSLDVGGTHAMYHVAYVLVLVVFPRRNDWPRPFHYRSRSFRKFQTGYITLCEHIAENVASRQTTIPRRPASDERNRLGQFPACHRVQRGNFKIRIPVRRQILVYPKLPRKILFFDAPRPE